MNNDSRNSGRRRSGRGSRRSTSQPRQDPRFEGRPAAAPAKKSLWQKIISIFSPSSSASATPARNGGNGAPRTQHPARAERPERPAYEPRPQRTDRPAYEPRSDRKPEAIEVTSPKLYVGNLSFDAAENDLTELFNGVGIVQGVELVTHKMTEKSKGFGFVTMTSIEEAKRAVTELHDKEFMGRKLVVSGAKTGADRSA